MLSGRKDFVRLKKAAICLSIGSIFLFHFALANSENQNEMNTEVAKSDEPKSLGEQIRFPVEKYQLENGLTVLLQEDHSVPLVSYHTWFRVGSINEEAGYTGIAHLFEHMMFKGAKRYTGSQFDTVLQGNGATNNAFTTKDYTGYYEDLPSSKLELIMDIESDRMVNLQINPANLTSEQQVVKEERRYRIDNNPMGTLIETMFGTIFKVHPYRWPTAGYMADIDRIDEAKSNQFYRTYYAPNNAVLVIAGDIDRGKVKGLVQKYYGDLKAQPIPKNAFPPEPEQSAARSQVIARDVQNTTFLVAYPVPPAGTKDSYALDLLANILGEGDSSRLHQRFVYKTQVATSASASNWTFKDSGVFLAYMSLKPGLSEEAVGEAQKSIYGEMWRMRNRVVSAADLEKAKNQVMKGYVDKLKTVHGKAESLAYSEIYFSDYSMFFKDLDRYNEVTVEEVQKVAQKYLVPEKSSLVVLKPKAQPPQGR